MLANESRSLGLIFHHEQGYVNHPKDPGGATNHGVTIKTLAAARGHAVTVADVQRLTKEEAHTILQDMYATPIRFNELPSGLDHAMLDFAVNSGPARAVKELQRIVGTSPDGVMGGKTLLQVNKADMPGLIIKLCNARLAFCKRLSTWKTFGRGWERRITGKDPLRKLPPQLGVVGEAVAMYDGKKPKGIDPAPQEFFATAKARDSDVKLTATTAGKFSLLTTASAGATACASLTEALAPYSETLKVIGYAVLAATVVGAVCTAVVAINHMKEAGADA